MGKHQLGLIVKKHLEAVNGPSNNHTIGRPSPDSSGMANR